MAQPTTRLFSASTRSTNAIALPGSETWTAGGGWTLGAQMLTAAATNSGPFGFGTGYTLSVTGGAQQWIRRVVGTFAATQTVSMFFKQGTATTVRVDLRDTTNALSHSVDFAWSGGTLVASNPVNAAVGAVEVLPYEHGFVRVSVSFTVGAPGSGATIVGSARRLDVFVVDAPANVQAWGAQVEDGVTVSSPYITGFAGGSRPLPVIYPQRITSEVGIFQIQMLNTPDATLNLEARLSQDAPWYTVLSYDEPILIGGTYAALIGVFPEMRVKILELNNATTTLDVWITE